MPHILIVCTANICRSPVGAALLQRRLQERGLSDWTVSSAGTWARMRRGAARHSIRVAANRDLDITPHQSEMIEAEHLRDADLVLCMESGHVEALRAEFPQYGEKIYLFSEMVDKRYDIADPYGKTLPEYEIMARELEQLTTEGLDRIIALAQRHAENEG
jgi:protein-tyrosine phosphatase